MTHLYLIRHADYIYDMVDGKFPRRDQGLSAVGVKQAERLRDRLANGEIKPDVFISSTERGAHETAQVIAPVFGLPILLDKDVEEWRSEDGTLTDEEFFAQWERVPESQKPYFRWIEGCESLSDFSLRVHQGLNRILQTHEGKTIVILTHGAYIQVTFSYFFGFGQASSQWATAEIRRTSITHWYKNEAQTRWTLERSNDCHHCG